MWQGKPLRHETLCICVSRTTKCCHICFCRNRSFSSEIFNSFQQRNMISDIEKTTFLIVDTQSIKNTAVVTDRKGHWMLLSITRNRCWRWSIFLPIGPIRASLLRTGLLKYLEQRSQLPSVMSFTLLKWCHNDGSLSALLAVLKNAGNFGKTVNFSSIPGCN